MANGECRVEDSFTVKELRIIEWKWYRVMTSSFSPHDSPNLLTGRPAHGRRTAARPAGRRSEEWTIEQVGAEGRSSSSLIEQDVVVVAIDKKRRSELEARGSLPQLWAEIRKYSVGLIQ